MAGAGVGADALVVPRDAALAKLHGKFFLSEATAHAREVPFTYYMTRPSLAMGRSDPDAVHGSDPTMPAAEGVDVGLGDSNKLSRNHAAIAYDPASRAYLISCRGKNGLSVTSPDLLHTVIMSPATAPVPLASRSLVQMGDALFVFLLPARRAPRPPPPPRPRDWIKAEHAALRSAMMRLGYGRWDAILRTAPGRLAERAPHELIPVARAFVAQCWAHARPGVERTVLLGVLHEDAPDDNPEADVRAVCDKAVADAVPAEARKYIRWARKLRLLKRLRDVHDHESVARLRAGELRVFTPPPTRWWTPADDADLLVGTYKHGYGMVELLRADREFGFHRRCSPALLAPSFNVKKEMDVDAGDAAGEGDGDDCDGDGDGDGDGDADADPELDGDGDGEGEVEDEGDGDGDGDGDTEDVNDGRRERSSAAADARRDSNGDVDGSEHAGRGGTKGDNGDATSADLGVRQGSHDAATANGGQRFGDRVSGSTAVQDERVNRTARRKRAADSHECRDATRLGAVSDHSAQSSGAEDADSSTMSKGAGAANGVDVSEAVKKRRTVESGSAAAKAEASDGMQGSLLGDSEVTRNLRTAGNSPSNCDSGEHTGGAGNLSLNVRKKEEDVVLPKDARTRDVTAFGKDVLSSEKAGKETVIRTKKEDEALMCERGADHARGTRAAGALPGTTGANKKSENGSDEAGQSAGSSDMKDSRPGTPGSLSMRSGRSSAKSKREDVASPEPDARDIAAQSTSLMDGKNPDDEALAVFAALADADGRVPFPSTESLMRRLKSIVNSCAKEYDRDMRELKKRELAAERAQRRKDDLAAKKQGKVIEKKRLAEERRKQKSQPFSKKDASEFERALVNFGVDYNTDGRTVDWAWFISKVPSFQSKYTGTLDAAFQDIMSEAHRIMQLQAAAEDEEEDTAEFKAVKNAEPSALFSTLTLDRAERLLERVEFFRFLRVDVLTHPRYSQLLRGFKKTRELPLWWRSVHDRALLWGVDRHGLNAWESVEYDPELIFSSSKKTYVRKNADDAKALKRGEFPKAGAATKRAKGLVAHFRVRANDPHLLEMSGRGDDEESGAPAGLGFSATRRAASSHRRDSLQDEKSFGTNEGDVDCEDNRDGNRESGRSALDVRQGQGIRPTSGAKSQTEEVPVASLGVREDNTSGKHSKGVAKNESYKQRTHHIKDDGTGRTQTASRSRKWRGADSMSYAESEARASGEPHPREADAASAAAVAASSSADLVRDEAGSSSNTRKRKRPVSSVIHDDSLDPELPMNLGDGLFVLNMGELEPDNELFCNRNALFPVGYRAIRVVDERDAFLCEVFQSEDGTRPVFRTSILRGFGYDRHFRPIWESSDRLVESYDILEAAMVLGHDVRSAVQELDAERDREECQSSGAAWFGLCHPTVVHCAQKLPGASRCPGYMWREYEESFGPGVETGVGAHEAMTRALCSYLGDSVNNPWNAPVQDMTISQDWLDEYAGRRKRRRGGQVRT